MNKKSLIKLWKEEKGHYSSTEIGSGVQKFVKEVFKSQEIFNLGEGKLSTDIQIRKYEFLEEAKKKGHRADVVIFIDSEIIIPVEVERFQNIKAGEKQIFQYQTDWQKKLGLLTDGHEWRFYNNLYIEKIFTIDEILNKTDEFLTFWQDYIKPEHYYKSFFEKQGQLILFEFPPPNVDDVRQDFFFDITKLIETFKNKLKLKGFFDKVIGEEEKGKKAVEITYAYLIQFILYKTLVDNAFSDFEEDWNQRMENIDKALKAEIFGDVLSKIKTISDKISANVYKRFSDEQLIINQRLDEILKRPKQEIGDISIWLDILLFISRYNFANVQNEIFGYIYENYLKDLYLNEKKGQFFTDPHVVDFMLTEMGYNKEELKKRYKEDTDSISIIDPSCGSGTFLYNATARLVEAFFDGSKHSSLETEKIISDNIFGLDIAEFPLYLAEMNILMRMLPVIIGDNYNSPQEQKIRVLKTRDSISEFLDTSIRNTLTDMNQTFQEKGGAQMNLFTEALELGYHSFMRDKGDLDELKNSLELKNNLPRLRFDYVVGNPPYVGYNQCSKQGILFIEMMKKHQIQMSNIYGMNLNTVPDRIKPYSPKPNLYSFFIALGNALLKDNGKFCYIIPQTLLTANDLDVVRYHLSKYLTIEKIIMFNTQMFIGRGILQNKPIPTSSLILIFQKRKPSQKNKIEVINYSKNENSIEKILSDISLRKNVKRKYIQQNELLQNVLNWNFIKFDSLFLDFYKNYISNSEDTDIFRSKLNLIDDLTFDGGVILDDSEIVSDTIEDGFEVFDYKQNNWDKFNVSSSNIFCKNNSNFKFPSGSQGMLAFNKKYKIVWRTKFAKKFQYTERKILLINNQSLLVSSDSKDLILYYFGLINSKVNLLVLMNNLKQPNEKDYLVALRGLKNYIRFPKESNNNLRIRKEIIKYAEIIISLEDKQVGNLVKTSSLLLQKFDKLSVVGNELIIEYKGKSAKCKIIGDTNLVEKCIDEFLNTDLFTSIGNLNDLKQYPAFDKEYQMEIKDYIDDLVFALYFKVDIPDLGYEYRKDIKELCRKNKFYKIIEESINE